MNSPIRPPARSTDRAITYPPIAGLQKPRDGPGQGVYPNKLLPRMLVICKFLYARFSRIPRPFCPPPAQLEKSD